MEEGARYRVEPGAAWIAHELGPMTVVYHRRSGITHMVGEPVPQILEALASVGPADAGAVTQHLSKAFDLDAEDALETVVAARLVELAALGLIVREGA
jgi:PqqD family protein of HPr-rel-A system